MSDLAKVFADLECNLRSVRLKRLQEDAQERLARIFDCLACNDYYSATRLYDDVKDIYNQLPANEKALLYTQCKQIHEALLDYHHKRQWPKVRNLLRDYKAMHRIQDWATCKTLYQEIMTLYALLPQHYRDEVLATLQRAQLPQEEKDHHYSRGLARVW